MLTAIHEVTPQGDFNKEIATYALDPLDSLISYVIAYVLKQAGNLLNEDLREKVKSEIKTGKVSYMYFTPDNHTFYVKK